MAFTGTPLRLAVRSPVMFSNPVLVLIVIEFLSFTDAVFMKMKKLQVQPIKVWLKELELKKDNIFTFLSRSFYEQFNNDLVSLANTTLNVTVSQKMPYVNMFRHRYEGHNHEICGYVGDLWHELEDVLHFNIVPEWSADPHQNLPLLKRFHINMSRVPFIQLYYRYPVTIIIQTNFTVKSEIIDEREALKSTTDNLILNPILLKSGDHKEFDSTMPIAITWFQLSVLNPKSGSSFFYMSIFTTSLMAMYLVTMIILTLALWFIIQINTNKKLKIQEREKQLVAYVDPTVETDSSFMASFLTILGTLTNQGIQLKPSTISIKLIILSSTLFGFVLIQSYSAVLLSQLAVNQIPSPVHLEKLPYVMPYRSLCVSERSIAYSHFLENDSTEILHQWKPILNRPPCTLGQIDIIPLQDYCNEKTMVLESRHSTNYIRNKANFDGSNSIDCSFYSFPRRYFNSYFSLLTKKDFRYTGLISIYLLKFHTTGIIKRLQDIWLPISPVQDVKVNQEMNYTDRRPDFVNPYRKLKIPSLDDVNKVFKKISKKNTIPKGPRLSSRQFGDL